MDEPTPEKDERIQNANGIEMMENLDIEVPQPYDGQLNLKVQTNESEAIIELGDEYKFKPTLENLFYLEEIFGKDVIQI